MSPSALLAPTPGLCAAAAAVFVLAGLVKGVVGLGLPTVAMALLALRLAPADAAALLLVPSLATNLWQLRPLATLGATLRRLWPLQAAAFVGTVATGQWIGAPAGAWASAALGAVLVAYAAWGALGHAPRVGPRAERLGAPLVGLATGAVTAATGVFVVPAVPWLQALGLEREALIQAMGLSFSCSTVALAVTLGADGHATGGALALSAALLVPAFVGMALGAWLRRRLSPVVFRRCFFAGLAALGLYMMVAAALAR